MTWYYFLYEAGLDVTQLFSFLFSFFEYIFCTVLFAVAYRRKKLYVWRLLVSAVLGLAFCFLCAVIMTVMGTGTDFLSMFTRILLNTLLSLFFLAMLWGCYEESFTECMLCWCMVVAVSTLAGQSYSVLLNIFGVDDSTTISFFNGENVMWYDYLIWGLYHMAVFVGFAALFAKRTRLQHDTKTTFSVVMLAFSVAVVSYILGSVARVYEDASAEMAMVTKLFKILCSLFVIFMALGVFQQSKLEQDLQVTEQLLEQEKRQYEISKQNVEAINMKCHDLKHRLNSFEHKLNDEELESLKEAIELYDTNIRTGNEILDVVLYEKQLYCNSTDIRLSFMVDGTRLAFMDPSHTYSLFGNAIDNAIEAVTPIEDADKRMIGVSMGNEDGGVSLEFTNYFLGERKISGDGMPQTTKEDTKSHGYGMKSMQYIVKQYRGRMETQIYDDIFILHIRFPAQG